MAVQFGFIGFRHPHIFDMYHRCLAHADIDVAASCEEHGPTREALAKVGDVKITDVRFDDILDRCDVIAVGDCYGLRAERIVKALESGKHVISDKPVCISPDELSRIKSAAEKADRVVGCMLDMRDLPVYLGLRDAIQSGKIGTVHAVSFDGQHPLLFGKRPDWYFEPGMHGGVLNDITVHAVDFLPWATGLAIDKVVAAREWNATLPEHPNFRQCGQAMFTLENGAGVICDVSYLTPDSFAYEFPYYWRFTIWGADGVLEAGVNSTAIQLFRNGDRELTELPLPEARPGAYLASFLQEIGGRKDDLHLSSADVFRASETSLQLQQMAAT